MLDEMLPELPDDLRELVVERADGNPFFLEELVGELVDSGVLVQSDDGWVVGRHDARRLRCRTRCTPCWRRASTGFPRSRRPRFRRARSSGVCSGERRSSTCSTASEPDFGCSRSATSSLPCARSAPSEDPSSRSSTRSRARSRTARSRKPARPAPRGARRLARASGGTGRACAAAGVPLRRGGEARGRGPRLGATSQTSSHGCARGLSTGSRARAGSRAGDTRSTRRSSSTRAVELSTTSTSVRCCGGQSARPGAPLRRRRDAAAMLSALDGPLDDAERADTYALLAFQSSIRSAMWSIRLNMELIEEWAARRSSWRRPGARRRRGRCSPGQRRAARCSGGRARGGVEARRVARQPRAPVVRAGSENAGSLRPAAFPGGGRPGAINGSHCFPDRRSGSSLRGLRGGLARGGRRLPLRRGAAVGRAARRPLAAAVAAPPRPFGLARAGARGRARRLARPGCADGSRAGRDRGEPRDAVRAESSRPAALQPRAPLPRGRVPGDRARARRAASRRRGLRDVSERRAAPDRPRARRPSRDRVARRASRRACARLGAGDLRGAARRLHRARTARPDRA